MTKTFQSLFLALGILTANTTFASVPTEASTFDTNITTYGMTNTQESKIARAEEKIRAVIGSSEFRSKILNFSYKGVKKFFDNGGLSNSAIYAKILNGAEKLTPSKNNAMDMGIKVYFENSSTVGYTSTGSKHINMNTKFLNTYTANQVTRNMIHEWLHKLGFHHAVNYSSSRDYSVPYGVGKIMEQLAVNY